MRMFGILKYVIMEPFFACDYTSAAYRTDGRYILGTALNLCNKLSVQWVSGGFAIRQKAQGFYGKV